MVHSTSLVGFYQYTYPTFVDKPQYICVHFLTEDGQEAFVSYPNNRSRKAGRLIPVSWFQSVTLLQLDGKPRLMDFVEMLFTQRDECYLQTEQKHWLANEPVEYELSQRLVA
jgi:hypothetical protein